MTGLVGWERADEALLRRKFAIRALAVAAVRPNAAQFDNDQQP